MPKPKDIDEYLASIDEPHRTTLSKLRATILSVAPKGTVETISYGMPAFKFGKHIAAFAAFKNHCSYFPYSGAVIEMVGGDLDGYKTSKGTVQFAANKPLPKTLVKKLIDARMFEIAARGR